MSKPCKHCESEEHTAFYCFQKPKKPIKKSTKKKAPVKKKRAKSRKQLVKELDSVFSQYIRLKDAINGMAACVTCPSIRPWKEMQCGHYESRGHYPTRWDEENCHVQDYACNVAKKGNYPNYARYMISRYGADKLEELHQKANSGIKISTPELRDMIEIYKTKLKEIL